MILFHIFTKLPYSLKWNKKKAPSSFVLSFIFIMSQALKLSEYLKLNWKFDCAFLYYHVLKIKNQKFQKKIISINAW